MRYKLQTLYGFILMAVLVIGSKSEVLFKNYEV